jgi:hypothetical protein
MKINYRVSEMENILKGLKLRNTFCGLYTHDIINGKSQCKHTTQLHFKLELTVKLWC